MYQVSRAIYRELSRDVVGGRDRPRARPARLRVDGRAARRRPPLLRPAGPVALPGGAPVRRLPGPGPRLARRRALPGVRRAAPGRAAPHRRRRQRQPAAVPGDDPPRHALPAAPAARRTATARRTSTWPTRRTSPQAPSRSPPEPRTAAPGTPPRPPASTRVRAARRPSRAVRQQTPFGGVVRPSSESCSPSGRFCAARCAKPHNGPREREVSRITRCMDDARSHLSLVPGATVAAFPGRRGGAGRPRPSTRWSVPSTPSDGTVRARVAAVTDRCWQCRTKVRAIVGVLVEPVPHEGRQRLPAVRQRRRPARRGARHADPRRPPHRPAAPPREPRGRGRLRRQRLRRVRRAAGQVRARGPADRAPASAAAPTASSTSASRSSSRGAETARRTALG